MPTASSTAATANVEWKTIDTGAERAAISAAGISAILYRFDPAQFSWKFVVTSTALTITEWASQEPQAVFLTNGVYFQPDFSPSGLFVTNKQRIGTRQFDPQRSGVLILAPQPSILDTSVPTSSDALSSVTEAAQSYPFLIKNGQFAVTQETGHAARRTFFGLDQQGRVYMGVVDQTPVTLFVLSKFLQQLPVAWRDVLNLDGGPSTGLVARFSSDKEVVSSLLGVSNSIEVDRYPH